MRGKLVTKADGTMKIRLYAGTLKVGTFKIDETFANNVQYMQNLIHRDLAELLIDASELTRKTARAIIDFIPVHLESARLQLAVKALIDNDFKDKSPLDRYSK